MAPVTNPVRDSQTLKQGEANKPLKLSSLFSRLAPNKLFFAILSGCIAGFAYSLIIPVVLASLRPASDRLLQPVEQYSYTVLSTFEVSTPKLALAFFVLCLVIFMCRSMSQIILSRLAVDVTKELRKDMYRRVSQLPIQDLERIGSARLLAAMTGDIPRIISGAAVFPDLLVNIATLFGLLGFLIYLNIPVFIFIMATILVGGLSYQIPIYFGSRYMAKARNLFDHIHESIRGLIYGAKELKLNQKKQQDFLSEELDKYEDYLAIDDKKGQSLIVAGITYGNLISFFAIGFVTYAMANYYSLSLEHLTGVVMVMLYITGPIAAIINAVAPISRASVALNKLQELQDEMPVEKSWGSAGTIDCNEIHLKDLTYTHINEDEIEKGFTVGPINTSFARGEITFLVGGNGSGKTTLAKMLSMHYLPTSGSIHFNDIEATEENRESCRQSISAIYTDFFLFSKLYDLDDDNSNELANHYIKALHLENKVKILNGRFSSISLSDGQKKRLALLSTYLEDRSIYVFDEWAADQDPVFREIFYCEILPGLRERGKLVIVISHDDRYFNIADKLIFMENGTIKSVKINSEYHGEGEVNSEFAYAKYPPPSTLTTKITSRIRYVTQVLY